MAWYYCLPQNYWVQHKHRREHYIDIQIQEIWHKTHGRQYGYLLPSSTTFNASYSTNSFLDKFNWKKEAAHNLRLATFYFLLLLLLYITTHQHCKQFLLFSSCQMLMWFHFSSWTGSLYFYNYSTISRDWHQRTNIYWLAC